MFALTQLLSSKGLTLFRTVLLSAVSGKYLSGSLMGLFYNCCKKLVGKHSNMDEMVPALSRTHKWTGILNAISGLLFIDMVYMFYDKWYMGIFVGLGIMQLLYSMGNFYISVDKKLLEHIAIMDPTDSALQYVLC